MGLIGAIFPMIIGAYVILLFTGKVKPKLKTEQDKQKFEEAVKKRGKGMIIAGSILIVLGIYQIFSYLS